ncbi:MAG: dihydroorotase [Coriobacteriia bacterium]|nr:dihydroorotase [Coriobacteriia bacterium]
MALLLKGGRLIDPACKLDRVTDIVIRDGKIVELGAKGKKLSIPKGTEIDCTGCIITPGLVDMHVHLRDPGYEYKEDLASGGAAAAKGGFTAVLGMPNTKPIIDTGSRVRAVNEKAREATRTKILVSGSLTSGLKGEALSEMGDMHAAGAVAFTDDGRGVQDNSLMLRAMEYVKQFGAPVLTHCQDEELVADGVVNEGAVSTRLGLAGWPALGEELEIARDIALCELTGCPLHIQHISTKRGVELVASAKEKGLPVTCEVTPHHLFLSEENLDETYNTNFKMNPPLRTEADRNFLVDALVKGTIDCVATDHAPHARHEKSLEFELAPFGTTGLETALSLMVTHLVDKDLLDWDVLVERMAHAPRRILALEAAKLKVGATADLTVIDPEIIWTVTPDCFESKSNNSAFIGAELKGRARHVFVDGYATLENGKVVA